MSNLKILQSVLDSSAQFEPGFIFGNNFLFGSLKECEGLQVPHSVTLSKRFFRNMKTNLIESVGPFDFEYNVIYAEHDSPWQIQTEFLLTRVKPDSFKQKKKRFRIKTFNF